ncbi:tRNA lysidine(34) synthetase TilS [Tamlana fucoidanivorans]|uniref:tRNA(Ile)-lysidine synthase n=1 Tax=Allotamlana fucoidanivorans TaxID=2583814 RepID=A0A5C4SHT5_9FLAO|nr:tRNA lysidine(34) synthetase TilS [Tamlana fucoidanivorans]TNJ42902.1 tRNA lysidine(34) synthetase TilS [Tamlana fucoidanivorans]
MLNLLQKHIDDKLSFLKTGKLLIAISGGVDSVVLTYLCHTLKLNITLAHCNFNLRSDESDADEDHVVQLADYLNLEVFVQRFDTQKYAQENKRSIQMAARELRYAWFSEIAEQLQFDYILTAHHADDNLETFLINFSRGTGLEGLTGIPEINGKFVRPLLPFSSEFIKAYAIEHNITWRDDSSNASVKYLRNKLRHEVIPILKEINPNLLFSFQTTLNNLNDASLIIKETMTSFLDQAIEVHSEQEIKFKIAVFKNTSHPKAYVFETFKPYGFTQWDDILVLLDGETGKQVFSSTHRLIKNREHLLLSPIKASDYKTILIPHLEKSVEIPEGILHFEDAKAMDDKDDNVLYADKSKLEYPIILRKKQEGDVFYPLGMQGKKKLSKYFKDEKLSLLDKEHTWLLCSKEAIVWVVGKRADNRFKVDANTKNILKITFVKHQD